MNNYRKSTRIYFMEDIKKQQDKDKKSGYTGVERNKDLENKKLDWVIVLIQVK
jgi:hypothetical protein